LFLVSGFVLIVALIFIGQLFLLQVVRGEEYRDLAERQYTSRDHIPFDRGDILMTRKNGETVALATLASGFTIAITPGKIKDAELTYKKLSALMPELDREIFFVRAQKKDDPYEELATHVGEDTGKAIADLTLPGVLIVRERWRVYPGGTLAAHVAGALGYKEDSDRLEGKYGIEKQYSSVLDRGDTSLYVNFFAEVFTELGNIVFDRGSKEEGSIELSIEPLVEAQLEDELAAIEETWQSTLTGGIVLDPKTGEIVAMAVTPSYDPNNLREIDPQMLRNPLVENVYEFGSIMKPLTIAAALDSKAITRNFSYTDTGSISIDGRTVSNYDGKARGKTPLQEILNQSLNVGTANVMLATGKDTFRRYMYALQFDKKTGIDLPNETAGITTNLESPRDIEYVTASFGQGVAVTPMAMARALSTLANKGALPSPRIGTTILRSNGLSKDLSGSIQDQVYSEETSRQVTEMLVEVVDKALVGGTVNVPTMSIAAKTGTAQISSPGGGYYDDRYLHSFFGYFPAYEPRFLIFLFTIEPKGVRYASETLTHPFMSLVSFLTSYYEIPPDRGDGVGHSDL
jgi:cell division protein FtsI/penicillin-binding protein 2